MATEDVNGSTAANGEATKEASGIFSEFGHVASHISASTSSSVAVTLDGASVAFPETEMALKAAKKAGAIWPVMTERSDLPESAPVGQLQGTLLARTLFQLVDCPPSLGVAAHVLPCCSKTIVVSEGSLSLDKDTCLVLDEACSDVQFTNVTFKGGLVVVKEEGCSVTFTDCTFESCTLLALRGAKATLRSSHFNQDCPEHAIADTHSRLSVIVTGGGTEVTMDDCSVEGGLQGIAVLTGASLTATHLICNAIDVLAIEATGADTTLTLSESFVRDIGADFAMELRRWTFGIAVQSGASATLTACSVNSAGKGLVAGKGAVKAKDCRLENCVDCCAYSVDSGELNMDACELSGSLGMHGLFVSSKAKATAESSTFAGNAQDGAFICIEGEFTANGCASIENGNAGFKTTNIANVSLTKCTSTGDLIACQAASKGSVLTVTGLEVKECSGVAFDISEGATANLTDCQVVLCKRMGASIRGPAEVRMFNVVIEGCLEGSGLGVERAGAYFDAESCKFNRNGKMGVAVGAGARASLKDCEASHNKLAGFAVLQAGQLVLQESASRGNVEGCGAVGAGSRLTADNVEVSDCAKSGFVARTGSKLNLRGCSAEKCGLFGFVAENKSQLAMRGCRSVSNRCGCGATGPGSKLSGVAITISDIQERGIDVVGGSNADLRDSSVSTCAQECMLVVASAAIIMRCDLRDSAQRDGLRIGNCSTVEVSGCSITGNKQAGICSFGQAQVVVDDCETKDNGTSGYWVQSGAIMNMSNCTSTGDVLGAGVGDVGSKLTCEMVKVFKSWSQGFLSLGGGRMELVECSAKECGSDGVAVAEGGSSIDVRGGAVAHNEQHGIVARSGATGKIVGVESFENKTAAFGSFGHGSLLELISCTSTDATSMIKRDGGRLESFSSTLTGTEAIDERAKNAGWMGALVRTVTGRRNTRADAAADSPAASPPPVDTPDNGEAAPRRVSDQSGYIDKAYEDEVFPAAADAAAQPVVHEVQGVQEWPVGAGTGGTSAEPGDSAPREAQIEPVGSVEGTSSQVASSATQSRDIAGVGAGESPMSVSVDGWPTTPGAVDSLGKHSSSRDHGEISIEPPVQETPDEEQEEVTPPQAAVAPDAAPNTAQEHTDTGDTVDAQSATPTTEDLVFRGAIAAVANLPEGAAKGTAHAHHGSAHNSIQELGGELFSEGTAVTAGEAGRAEEHPNVAPEENVPAGEVTSSGLGAADAVPAPITTESAVVEVYSNTVTGSCDREGDMGGELEPEEVVVDSVTEAEVDVATPAQVQERVAQDDGVSAGVEESVQEVATGEASAVAGGANEQESPDKQTDGDVGH